MIGDGRIGGLSKLESEWFFFLLDFFLKLIKLCNLEVVVIFNKYMLLKYCVVVLFFCFFMVL